LKWQSLPANALHGSPSRGIPVETMKKQIRTWTCEVLVLGKWIVASTGWSAVEKASYEERHPSKSDVRFVCA
jgi:hypothetical protein